MAGIGLVAVLVGGLGAEPAWPATAVRAAAVDLGTLPGATSSEALDINDEGTVVGVSGGRAVRWNPRGRITDLGTLPGGRFSYAVAINNHGVTAGQSTAADSRDHLVLWDRAGRITDLGTMPGGTWFHPNAITDDGTVFGHGDTAGGRPHPARWDRRAGFTVLPLPPTGYHGLIAAVNNSGIAIGASYGTNHYGHLVRWDLAGWPTDLGTPPHSMTRPADINDFGVVVGSTWPGIGPEFTPVRWTRRNGFTELRTPHGHGHANAVNNNGVAVGSWTGPDGDAPARWGRDGAMLTLRMPPGFALGEVYEINNRGTAVGAIERYDAESYLQLVVRWDPDGHVTDLGTIGGPQAWPTALNEHGTAVGYAIAPNGQVHAVLWPGGQ